MRTEIKEMYLRPDQISRLEELGCKVKPVKDKTNRFRLMLPSTAVVENEPAVLNGVRVMGHIRLRKPSREAVNSHPLKRMTWSAANGNVPAKMQGLTTRV